MSKSISSADRLEESMDSPETTYWARFGNFIFEENELSKASKSSKSSKAIYDSLVSALKQDSRVITVDSGFPNHQLVYKRRFYPMLTEEDAEDLLSGSSSFDGVRFSTAITFKVSVPRKNQPEIRGAKAEAETYLVAWDGWTVLVMWEPKDSYVRPSPANGQIVADILTTACQLAGKDLYIQACSPKCTHLFAHTDFKVHKFLRDDFDFQFTSEANSGIHLMMSIPKDNELLLARAVHDRIKRPAANFAQLKNVARRIIQIESSARSMSFELIAHDYENLSRSQDSLLLRLTYIFGDLSARLRGKSRAKHANILITSLWLSMANMDTLQQLFKSLERRYNDSFTDQHVRELFSSDLKSEETRVGELDPYFAQATAEHKSQRLDNRIIFGATLGGALAGAVITAIASGISALP